MRALMALPPSSWNNSPRPLLCQGLDQVLQGRTAEAGWCSTTRRLSFALEVCRGWFEPLAQPFPQGSCSLGAGGPRAADSTASPNTLRGSCEQPAAFCLCFLPLPHTLSHHLSLHSQCRANLPPESNCLKKQDRICLHKTPASFSARVTELRPVPAPCEYFQHCPCFPHSQRQNHTSQVPREGVQGQISQMLSLPIRDKLSEELNFYLGLINNGRFFRSVSRCYYWPGYAHETSLLETLISLCKSPLFICGFNWGYRNKHGVQASSSSGHCIPVLLHSPSPWHYVFVCVRINMGQK